MISASVGVGQGEDAFTAGKDACVQALSGLPGNRADALLVFGSVSLDQDKLVEGVSSAAPSALLVGCSSAGEITSEGLSMGKSVVVMGLASDQLKFWGAAGHHIIWNPRQAGEECANQMQYDSHGYIRSALLFVDVVSGNGDMALAGFSSQLGENFPVFGGSAADDLLFFQTFQYFKKSAHSGSVVGLGLSGDFHSAGVVMHGFLPIGVERSVTRSEGTTLYELNGKSAASIYEEYFGEEHLPELHEGLLPSLAVTFPLGVFSPESNDVLLRNPVFVDKKGSMTFTSAIPEGAEVRLMISDTERGLETAERAAIEVMNKLEGRKPKAVIIVNSVARKKMFGTRADEEIEVIQRVLGRDVPIAGFYSYAQIGSEEHGISFHNSSLLIWALAE